MERRHRSKNIGAFGVYRFKNTNVEVGIKPGQTGSVAFGCSIKLETMQLNVPGRRGRIEVVHNKAEEINQHKREREIKKLPAPGEKQIGCKSQRHRYPA